MAFPTTGVLDNFAATENPIAAKWTSPIESGHDVINANAGLASGANPSVVCDAYYDIGGTFGPDTEVFIEHVTEPDVSGGNLQLKARLTSIGAGTTNGYELDCPRTRSTADEWRFRKITNSTSVQIPSSIFQEVSAGDSVGLTVTGGATTTLTAWYKPSGGSWTSIGSVTDSSSPFTSAGRIGWACQWATDVGYYTNFGGGTVVAAGITGTGSVAFQRPALASTAVETFSGAEALAIKVAALSGSGTETFTGTASETIRVAALAGTGAQTFTGTGTTTIAVAAITGTGAQAFTGTATETIRVAALAGAGTQTFTGTGSETIAAPVIAGTGAQTFTAAAGALTIRVAALDGVGAVAAAVTGTGGVVFAFALAGVGTVGSAAINGAGAVAFAVALNGVGVEAFTGGGAVAIGVAALGAAGVQAFTGTGIETIGAPALAGTGAQTLSGAASVAIGGPALSGTGTNIPLAITGAGGVALKVAGLLGFDLQPQITGSGGIAIRVADLSGFAVVAQPIGGRGRVAPIVRFPPIYGEADVRIAAPRIEARGTVHEARGAVAIAVAGIAGLGSSTTGSASLTVASRIAVFARVTVAPPVDLAARGTVDNFTRARAEEAYWLQLGDLKDAA